MKNLSTYIEEKINVLFVKYNGFFAFSESQIEEAKKQDIKYIYRGGGLYHEAGRHKEFDEEYKFIIKQAIEQDLRENGKEAIIKRELKNYESFYTCDISDTIEALKDYGISKEEIQAVFRVELSKYDD